MTPYDPKAPTAGRVLQSGRAERQGGRGAPSDSGKENQGRRRGVRQAVALEYRRGKQRAPTVTASGRGELAEQIIALARKHGIYVQPDPDLVELLSRLELGKAIPPQLYYVVAEILAFVYKLNSVKGQAL